MLPAVDGRLLLNDALDDWRSIRRFDDVEPLRTGATSVLTEDDMERFDVLAEVWTIF